MPYLAFVSRLTLIAAGLGLIAGSSSAGPVKSLHTFQGANTDGAQPVAKVISVDGILYGTTSKGGLHNQGTVFKADAKTGAETTLFSFDGAHGEEPSAGLTYTRGLLYGTTELGGSSDCGVVFSVNPGTGEQKVVYTVPCAPIGGPAPGSTADLLYFKGSLYGTARNQGQNALGIVFKVDLDTGIGSIVYTFSNTSDGYSPWAGLTAYNNELYGTTVSGGTYNNGTIFKLDPRAGIRTTLYSFTGGADGSSPQSDLTIVGSSVFGAIAYSGAPFCGLLFNFSLANLTLTPIYTFSGVADGCHPNGVLVVNNDLYGTAYSGGASNDGSVFQM